LLAIDIENRFVPVNFTVTDLHVEVAFGVRADPRLVVNRGSLTAEI
jgi:hypothetical protein